MSEPHNFIESYEKGELGVQLFKRLIINGLSETMTEFISLKDAHAIDEIILQKDMEGIDCYIEMKTDTDEHNINPVQVKTEYAVNTFIEIVSQVHVDRNKVKIGYALDNKAKSKYTVFVNYSHGVAIASTQQLRAFIQKELKKSGGAPKFGDMQYEFKKAYNGYKNEKYISIGVPVDWYTFKTWECVMKDWTWDEVLGLIEDDKLAREHIDDMKDYHLAYITSSGKSIEVKERRTNLES
jgi:hypothetical protein